ncbi:RNA polymerase sigma factor [Candidatus Entotheonella palauensis]|uniref:RNA polymerase sigma factor n=1 Tax=Candidatus Entotheonella palauensis TaxID=93172 RepID=UPI0015C4B6EF|nr:RNA polymerase sigma factor [Candidatus Entotheonella palauensis]
MTRDTELALMQQVQDGDHEAFETLFTCFRQRVSHQAHALLQSEADAEDIVQEVFAALYTKSDAFRGESAVSTWLYRVTVNAALSQKRYRQRRRTLSVEDLEQDIQPRWIESDGPDNLDQHVIAAERLQRLRQAIEELSPVDRAVIVLGDLQGQSNQITGDVLGLSEAAVKSRRHRARLDLREKLTAEAC